MQQLFKDTIIMIMKKLRLKEIINLGSTCKLFNDIIKTTEWKWDLILKDEYKSNHMLKIYIKQTSDFKQIIKNMSEIVSNCCIIFTSLTEDPQDFKSKDFLDNTRKEIDWGADFSSLGGDIGISRKNEDKSVLVKLILHGDKFKYFKCEEPKIEIDVDIYNLHTFLKTINDPIVLYIKRDNRSVLHIRSMNDNNESSEETDIKIFSMDMKFPEIQRCVYYAREIHYPKISFQNRITMASDKFHSICKHLNYFSTFVEITSIGNEILFKGLSERGNVTMSYKDINFTNKNKDKPEQVVQGAYESRNLMAFSKYNKLCDTIDIYSKNDFPLGLVMSMATLGKLYVFIAPVNTN
jgi:hypothetical protein